MVGMNAANAANAHARIDMFTWASDPLLGIE